MKLFVEDNFKTVPDEYRKKSVVQYIMNLWQKLLRVPSSPSPYDLADTARFGVVKVRGSQMVLRHPYIVPGGRFNEIYYWDSYFTMYGLGIAGRGDEVRRMCMLYHV